MAKCKILDLLINQADYQPLHKENRVPDLPSIITTRSFHHYRTRTHTHLKFKFK